MSKSNALEQELLDWVFMRTACPWAGETVGYLALHTADPGEGGVQTTSEIAYTGYGRVAMNLDGVTTPCWQRVGSRVSNLTLVQFGKCTGGSLPVTATHWSFGRTLAAGGGIYYKGQLTDPLVINLNIRPQYPPDTLGTTED
jgi:hypothetical protein